jgi:hypothetical protein
MAARTAAPERLYTWGSRALPVPYTVPWTGEKFNARTLTIRSDGTGLCYRDEKPADRDQHGGCGHAGGRPPATVVRRSGKCTRSGNGARYGHCCARSAQVRPAEPPAAGCL